MFVACNNVLFDFKKIELPLPVSDGRHMKTSSLPVGDFGWFFLPFCNSHFTEGHRETCLALHYKV